MGGGLKRQDSITTFTTYMRGDFLHVLLEGGGGEWRTTEGGEAVNVKCLFFYARSNLLRD